MKSSNASCFQNIFLFNFTGPLYYNYNKKNSWKTQITIIFLYKYVFFQYMQIPIHDSKPFIIV